MKRFLAGLSLAALFLPTAIARAQDTEATAVVDKAVEALGGAAKLDKAKGAIWSSKGTINFGGNEMSYTSNVTSLGLDKVRSAFSGEFDGGTFEGVTVVNGNKGWRKLGDMNTELDEDQLANEKRTIYLRIVPVYPGLLKEKGFKLENAGEEKEGDVVHNVLKVIGPDGKDFKIYFEKATGLPTKTVATVADFAGGEFSMTTTFKDFKDFGGIKKATKVESTRDGEKFVDETVTEFKTQESVDEKSFTEPE